MGVYIRIYVCKIWTMVTTCSYSQLHIYTVGPLLKNPLYKGQVVWSQQNHANTISPLKEDNLCIARDFKADRVACNHIATVAKKRYGTIMF